MACCILFSVIALIAISFLVLGLRENASQCDMKMLCGYGLGCVYVPMRLLWVIMGPILGN